MSANLSWDEFRLVKAIADSRSLTGAAAHVWASIIRRFFGGWRRSRSRSARACSSGRAPVTCRPTRRRDGRAGDHDGQLGRRIRETGRRPGRQAHGPLRVTTVEAIGQHFMPAIMAQFQAQNPGVVIELILSNRVLNLSRRDADVAIRLTNDPPETLVGRRICSVRWAVYCRHDVLARCRRPNDRFRPFRRIQRELRAAVGPAVDPDQNRRRTTRRESEFAA